MKVRHNDVELDDALDLKEWTYTSLDAAIRSAIRMCEFSQINFPYPGNIWVPRPLTEDDLTLHDQVTTLFTYNLDVPGVASLSSAKDVNVITIVSHVGSRFSPLNTPRARHFGTRGDRACERINDDDYCTCHLYVLVWSSAQGLVILDPDDVQMTFTKIS